MWKESQSSSYPSINSGPHFAFLSELLGGYNQLMDVRRIIRPYLPYVIALLTVAAIFAWLTWPALPVVITEVVDFTDRQMSIVIDLLGTAVAAFGIWLAVRIINRRETWAKWTAVGLVSVFVVYPLSFGPALWLNDLCGQPRLLTDTIYFTYQPLLWVASQSHSLGSALMTYTSLFVKLPHMLLSFELRAALPR